MKTVKDLWNELGDVFSKVKAGKMKSTDANAMNNSAGKMLTCARLQLEHMKMMGAGGPIDYFEMPKKQKALTGKMKGKR